jgi:hypothetical protein
MMLKDEEPIKIYIFPFGTEGMRVSHAALKYGDDIINYGGKGFSNRIGEPENCYIYNIYPSEVGINPKKLTAAIKKRKAKIKGKDYNYFTQNCADQVVAVLKEAGAKDIDQCLGISIPKLDGVPSLDDWAEKHGKLEQIPHEMTLHNYLSAMASKNKFHTATYFKLEEDRESIADYIKGICHPKEHAVYDIPKFPFQSYRQLTPEECAERVKDILMSYPERKRQLLIKPYLKKLAANRNNISKRSMTILTKAGVPETTFTKSDKMLAQNR